QQGVPWGISESAFNLVDRHGNYQYKAFGVPGLGLKRGLGDELVVAPYATALAAMVDPARAAHNFRRLAREGLDGAYGFYEAIDYTHRKADEGETVSEPQPHGPRGGGPALPVASHPVPSRPVPIQRGLHRHRHQRRRRGQLLPRPRRHPVPRGLDP